MESFAARQARKARAESAKASAVAAASTAVESLWKSSLSATGGFTNDERKAIAEASQALRSIAGGWANRRGRR